MAEHEFFSQVVVDDVDGLQVALDAKAALGAPAAAVAAHEVAADPHPQYLRQVEADALYAPVGAGGGDVTAHEAAADPHAQYLTESDADVRYARGGGIDVPVPADSTTPTIVHGLGSTAVHVTVYEVATGARVGLPYRVADGDSVVLRFATAPTAGQYRAMVLPTTAGGTVGAKVVVLDASEPLPAGLADGTVVLRRQPQEAPLVDPVQTFDTASGTWPAPWASTEVAPGGAADTTAGAGRLRSGTAAYAATMVARGGLPDNVDIELRFQTDGLAERYMEIRGRRSTDGTGYYVLVVGIPWNTLRIERPGNVLLGEAYPTWSASTWYRVRFQIVETTIRARVWADGDPEPTTWAITVTDATFTTGATLAIRGNNGADATVATWSIDDIELRAL